MIGMKFAEPLFLYLLFIVPAMVAFYIIRQQKAPGSVCFRGLLPCSRCCGRLLGHLLPVLQELFDACVREGVFGQLDHDAEGYGGDVGADHG